MSDIHFQPVFAPRPLEAIARYEPGDSSLTVGPGGMIPASMHRVSIDTLTLSLRPTDHIVVALDAYTNRERWERRPLAVPVVDHEAALRCTELSDEHGIAQADARPVQFIYSEEKALLRMEFGNGPTVTRFRCLSCAIFGLGANGELREIWVEF